MLLTTFTWTTTEDEWSIWTKLRKREILEEQKHYKQINLLIVYVSTVLNINKPINITKEKWKKTLTRDFMLI